MVPYALGVCSGLMLLGVGLMVYMGDTVTAREWFLLWVLVQAAVLAAVTRGGEDA